jgi:hypothetical protein
VVSGNQTLEGHLLQWLMREDADYFGGGKNTRTLSLPGHARGKIPAVPNDEG